MKHMFAVSRAAALLLLVVLAASGCSPFNSAANERQEQNEELTSGAVLGDIVTAEGIGANNAPVEVTNSFDTSQDFIYAVAEVERIEPGTTLFARWSRDGEPFEDSTELRADRLYENTFVEFHLENLQDTMEPGNYQVQFFVNGNPSKEAEFTVE